MVDVEKILPWGSPGEVETKTGKHEIRTADASPEFWDLWSANEQELKLAGVLPFWFDNGRWIIGLFNPPFSPVASRVAVEPLEPSPECEAACKANVAQNQTPLVKVQTSIPPEIAQRLRDYQLPGVETHIEALNRCGVSLDASDMGTGKTYSACAVALVRNSDLWVVCPKAVIPSWHEAASVIGLPEEKIHVLNYEKVKSGKTEFGEWRTVRQVKDRKTKEMKGVEEFFWNIPPGSILTFDEVHRCGAVKSQNAELLISAAKERKISKMLLSATIASEPMKMRAVGYALGLHNDADFFPWLLQNGYTRQTFRNANIPARFEWSCGLKFPWNEDELWKKRNEIMQRIRSQILEKKMMVRVRKDEIPGFPECDIYPVSLSFGKDAVDEMNRVYELMQQELDSHFEKESGDTRNPITIMLRARQRTELVKVPTIVEEVEDAIEQGYSVAVFVNFRETLEALSRRLKTRCVVHGGQTGDKGALERQQNIARFQADHERVILVMTDAGGAGISLHDKNGKFPRLAVILPTFWAENLRQATGRVWRDGAKTKAIQKIIFAAKTIEEKAYKASLGKLSNIDIFNDGILQSGVRVSHR